MCAVQMLKAFFILQIVLWSCSLLYYSIEAQGVGMYNKTLFPP